MALYRDSGRLDRITYITSGVWEVLVNLMIRYRFVAVSVILLDVQPQEIPMI